MGLDMYLYKTKRVNGLSAEDYLKVDNAVFDAKGDLDIEAVTGVSGLQDAIIEAGKNFHWHSILTEIGYWRKANAIHNWFVNNVQGGEDNCQLYEVGKDQLLVLQNIVNHVLESELLAEELLPTVSGFFFGGTCYDDYYREDLENTIDILDNVLNSTDFNDEIVFYRSSW